VAEFSDHPRYGSVAIAPNAFKGTLAATAACRAISEGVAAAWPEAVREEVPLSDGGDGFLETVVAAQGGTMVDCRVSGPLQEPVSARLGWVESRERRTAVAELARVCGLLLVRDPSPETAGRASTRGLGELLVVALRGRPRRLLIGIGGSSSTDGGAGLAQALGFRLLDRDGRPVPPGGLGLLELDRIEPPPFDLGLEGVEVVAACDVDNPLLGKLGAAAVFGPQKGADPAMVSRLDQGLARLAEVVSRDLGRRGLEDRPGMGAAGGTAFGLTAFLGARLERGVDLVAGVAGLDRALGEADVVFTGEGRFDAASLHGKVTGEVLRRASARGLPCVVLTGSADPEPERLVRKMGGLVVRTAPTAGTQSAPSRELATTELRAAAVRACRELEGIAPRGRSAGGPGEDSGQ
jgi:glycerate kinase